jgi:ubiquinone biosynthesis protein COQ9
MTNFITEQKAQYLTTALYHVAFEGWTDSLIQKISDELGLDPNYFSLVFRGGIKELVGYSVERANMKMLVQFQQLDISSMKVREKIYTIIKLRLESINKQVERRTLAYYSLPHNAATGLKNLWQIVDMMWYECGDISTDYNHYSKRMLLALVYSRTLCYYLNDETENNSATWEYLTQSINKVLKFGNIKTTVKNYCKKLPFIRLL